MTVLHSPEPDIDPAILLEAADWLVLLQSGEATERDRMALAHWRERNPAHEAAWRRAENMLSTFDQVPPKLGHDTFSHLGNPGRRQMLRLGLLALAMPAAWITWRHSPWQEWVADLRTATGEQKLIDLNDGTHLVLNTTSAANVAFTTAERRLILLAGEILVTTGRDPSPVSRPFIVQTAHGSLRALGTRFTVRHFDDRTQVAVLEGAVEVHPAVSIQTTVLRAGEQMIFTGLDMQPVRPVEASTTLWEHGMLLARDMHLGELIAELNRYHRGVLRCDPSVASLAISGAFPVTDIPASLSLLETTLPIHISRTISRWITVQAR